MRRLIDYDVYETEVNTANKRLIQDFLIEKKSQGRSINTLKTYKGDLAIIAYLVYQHFDNKSFIELTRKDIRNLMVLFQERGMSNARANGIMSALRSCLDFCSDDDDYDYNFNIASKIKGLPKRPVREIVFLSDEQINWLIDTLERKGDYLLAMYTALSYYSAARKNEVYQVKKSGLIDRYYTNIVTGKRGKEFRLYYEDRTRQLIGAYLEMRGIDMIPELFVKIFRNGHKRLVHKATFNYWCEILARMLSEQEGKEIKINPHAFRHSRLQNLSESGVPLLALKGLANHEETSTTESYLAPRNEQDLAKIFGMDAKYFIA